MNHAEFSHQVAVCRYLNLQYPDVLYLSDTIANLKLTPQQQARNNQIQKKDFRCPDILVLEPAGKYSGLFIELKTETPFTKNGQLKKQKVSVYKTIRGTRVKVGEYDHLQEQQKSINKLVKKGYFACFSWDVKMTISIIDDYFNQKI